MSLPGGRGHPPVGTRDGLTVGFDPLHGILDLVIERPPGNRVGLAMLRHLDNTLRHLRDLPSTSPVRAVVLSARGRDFSHGADLADAELASAVADDPAGLAALGQRVVETLDRLPIPTVAALTGRTIGAGACLAAACDFRFTSVDATLHFPEVDRGMHLSWGILPILVREFGTAQARRLALLGEAVAWTDLAAAVVLADAPLAEAHACARRLADKPPLAVRAILETLRDGHGGEDSSRFAATTRSADFVEAMVAWKEKRPGRFAGR